MCVDQQIQRAIREQERRLMFGSPMRSPAFVMIRRDLEYHVRCITSAYFVGDVQRVEGLDIHWTTGGPDVLVIPEDWQGFAQGVARPSWGTR
jgi:hypothetical protein